MAWYFLFGKTLRLCNKHKSKQSVVATCLYPKNLVQMNEVFLFGRTPSYMSEANIRIYQLVAVYCFYQEIPSRMAWYFLFGKTLRLCNKHKSKQSVVATCLYPKNLVQMNEVFLFGRTPSYMSEANIRIYQLVAVYCFYQEIPSRMAWYFLFGRTPSYMSEASVSILINSNRTTCYKIAKTPCMLARGLICN